MKKKDTQKKGNSEDLKQAIREKRALLTAQQQKLKEHKIPVLVLVEGWGTAGKGTLISNLIKELDPRFYDVIPMDVKSAEDARKPFAWRFMEKIPEEGKFVFLDTAWMEEIVEGKVQKHITSTQKERQIRSVQIMERQLADNGYVVIKLFMDIPEKDQKKRMDQLKKNKDTQWRIGKNDLLQIEKRAKYEKEYVKFIEKTSTKQCPWYLLDAKNQKEVLYDALCVLTERIQKKLDGEQISSELTVNEEDLLLKKVCLSDTPLDQNMTREEYEKRLKELQKKLKGLHNVLYRKKIPVIIAYEGWDAAGKGGNIKRLSSALDPRGFKVNPIASPEPHEKARHYLWRFWHRLPKNGHIAIFDRSWYGRVMVERLEGFCTEADWKRAYHEMNEFEKELSDWGAIVIKFWIQIDKDTQLARFTERQNTPEKQWKITEEDWRNREKWDQYETAVQEMIQKTSTKNAPWYIIPSKNKYYARIAAMEILIQKIEERVKEK